MEYRVVEKTSARTLAQKEAAMMSQALTLEAVAQKTLLVELQEGHRAPQARVPMAAAA